MSYVSMQTHDGREMSRPTTGRWTEKAFWFCAAAAAFYCAFVLPFDFPLKQPVYGSAYTAGENITVAAVGVALVSAVAGLLCALFRPSALDEPHPMQLSRRYLAGGLAFIVTCTTVLGTLVFRQGDYYADAGYFLVYLKTGLRFHRTIYRQFQFDYGPLLYFWPAAFIKVLARAGVSMHMAYLVSVVAMEALGVVLLFYIVNALPMRRQLKAAAFCLTTFAAFDMLLGINYAILRGVLAFATLVFLSRQKGLGRAIAVAFFGEILQLLVSPELGVAFGGATIVYGLYRVLRSGWQWALVSVAACAGAAGFGLVISPEYLHMFRQASNGGFNIVLEPLPYVLALLIAVVLLAPRTLSRLPLRRSRVEDPSAAMLLALFVASLGMLPAAFNRCDPLHAYVNGIGAYLLSFVAIDRFSRVWQRSWIVFVALIFAGTQFQEAHAFRGEIKKAFQDAPPDRYDDPSILPGIVQAAGHEKVTLPFNYGLRLIDGLTDAGVYQPGYYNAHFDSTDTQSEQRRVADMRSAEFAMVPIGQDVVEQDEIDNRAPKRRLLFGYTYKPRRAPFFHGALLMQELQRNWQPVGIYGPYTLYRKMR